MKPVHPMLEPLEGLESMLGRKIGFISMQTPDRSAWYRWLPLSALRQFAYQQVKHCEMAWEVLRDSRAEMFLVYEFNAPYVFPLLAALFLRGKPSFLLMHGIQQLASRSLFHALGFRLTRFFVGRLNGYAVHLELSDLQLPPRHRMPASRTLLIPLPHPLAEIDQRARWEKSPLDPIKIGVVGMLREGKKTKELIDYLAGFDNFGGRPVEILFGTPFWQKKEWVDTLDVDVRDTSTTEQYEALLQELDIFVCGFDKSDYYFRPSGVIGDALMNGCYVVCPDFPVFRAQIETPVRVGRAYACFEDLDDVIRLACDDIASGVATRFAQWREYRKVRNFADRFGRALAHGAWWVS